MKLLPVATVLLLALAGCNKAPEPGSVDDKSAEGAMVRKAVADVDAAQAAAASKPAKAK
ncbi:hypothetical protein [Polymorphobacter arshaanensis]|uniref:hypothetical protein n=1 Tax=Glacieibacterium arshaanense TaxID=2511025 RepID=UPI00140BA7C9|nr:hypothetical protein [Polymorphobacter arshaanensis]